MVAAAGVVGGRGAKFFFCWCWCPAPPAPTGGKGGGDVGYRFELEAKFGPSKGATGMASFVEAEVFVVLSQPPEKQQIDKDKVQSIREGDSSGQAGMPHYCVVTFTDGSEKKIKGRQHDVRALFGR
jgi:hypothetical protein